MTARDPEAEYYQAIEEFFVARRGDPLFLSNADWLLIRRWRKAGLPLRIVLRGIGDALEGHAHSWGRARKVGSLRYCEAEVEVARERWERALTLGSEPERDLGATLVAFAEALRDAHGLDSAATSLAERISVELLGLAQQDARPREIEPKLASFETRLVGALGGDASIEAQVDATLAPYRQKLPPKVFAELRQQSLIRERLAAHGLPRLSLFGL